MKCLRIDLVFVGESEKAGKTGKFVVRLHHYLNTSVAFLLFHLKLSFINYKIGLYVYSGVKQEILY